ncbi:bacteriocin [Aeromonas veronii]|uniref:bacteriocin n=1 Tax=Aeromonas veronii TaxID=654 RepID=UPI001933D2F5|nr:bacteriocin [Aeromonas veronii]MBM0416304.1 bacteriocin [Aeromonas veronii]MBW3788845.1 bacteriocin [Aeromonas veronii]
MGYGLLDIGAQTRQQGMMGLRDAANREQEVESANKSLKAARKQQTMSSIGAGASMGMLAGGPVGALVGGGIGFLADSLF